MKKTNCIKLILIIVAICVSNAVRSQNNSITQIPISQGPYAYGQMITLTYTIGFTKQADYQQQIKIDFDPAMLELVTLDLSASSNAAYNPFSSLPGQAIYRTDPFLPGENNFSGTSEFTLSFRIKNSGCTPTTLTTNITVKFSTIRVLPSFTETDIVSAATTVGILNTGFNAAVTLEKKAGKECEAALYLIRTFGKDIDNASNNSTLTLTLPNCAVVTSVNNTSGQPVVFSSNALPGNLMAYSWPRSGDVTQTEQIHYVMVNFNCPYTCGTMSVSFQTHNICDNSPASANAVPRVLNCCNEPPDGTVVISTPGCPQSGKVLISKTLVKTPLRYFPFPDNCRTHDYYIRIDNFSCYDLSSLKVQDLIEDVVLGISGEIKTENITVSLIPFTAGTSMNFEFDFSALSASGSIPPLIHLPVLPGAGASLHAGWVCPPNTASLLVEGTTVLPRESSLLIKINHRLDARPNPLTTNYDNKATVSFKAANNTYSGTVTCRSNIDSYEPVIELTKSVRNVSVSSSTFGHAVNAVPGDAVEFEIRIKNYGISSIPSAVFTDLFPNPNGYFTSTAAVHVTDPTGMSYTNQELADIQNTLNASLNSNSFSGNIKIAAARCLGQSELVIKDTFYVKDPTVVLCNSQTVNTAKLQWYWENAMVNKTADAQINIDLFKKIEYKLEATCKNPLTAQPSDWKVNNINAVPGQKIYYRATVLNSNAFDLKDLKMLILLPNGATTSTSTQQGSITLTANCPATPSNTGLYAAYINYTGGTGVGNTSSTSTGNNWLVPPNTAIFPSAGNPKSIFRKLDLPAGSSATINYEVEAPNNNFGQTYNTSFGLSINSTNPRSLLLACPNARMKDLNLTISQYDDCGHAILGCDNILFKTKITPLLPLAAGKFRIEIYDILDVNGASAPNIDVMDIIVHQPVATCVSTVPAPNKNMMHEFNLLPGTIATSYTPFTPLPVIQNYDRIITINNNGGPVAFGKVSFDIKIGGYHAQKTNCRSFPINIVFRDKNNSCTICEKTIYLRI